MVLVRELRIQMCARRGELGRDKEKIENQLVGVKIVKEGWGHTEMEHGGIHKEFCLSFLDVAKRSILEFQIPVPAWLMSMRTGQRK